MTSRKAWIAGFAGLLFMTTAANAQIPSIPGAAGAGLGAGTAGTSALGAASGAAGAPRTVWGMLGLSHENLAACKLKICRSPIGQALNSFATGPLSAVSGGLLSNCCPPPTAGEIAALEAKGGPQGAQAVAAKIQADEADAKARVAAVDYLGTVDCRYWKEAQIALLNALRADRNECVRYAAARAFNNGCCCSKEVIESLRIVVAGEDTDGFPAESSSRIKGTAFAALQNCLMKVSPGTTTGVPLEPEQGPAAPPVPLSPELTPERAATASINANDPTHLAATHLQPIPSASQSNALVLAGKPAAGLSVFESRVRFRTFASVVTEAQRTLYEVSQSSPVTSAIASLPAGKQSVLHALVKARQDVAANGAAKQSSNTTQRMQASDPSTAIPSLQPTPPQEIGASPEPFQAPTAPPVPEAMPPVVDATPPPAVVDMAPTPVSAELAPAPAPVESVPAAAPTGVVPTSTPAKVAAVAASVEPAKVTEPLPIEFTAEPQGASASPASVPAAAKVKRPSPRNEGEARF